MENFEQNLTISEENIEKTECIKFVNEISTNILDTFPFESDDQKKNFIIEIDNLLEKNDVLSDAELLCKNIRISIASLDNSHTFLIEKNKEKQFGLESGIYYKANKFWFNTENGTFEILRLNNISISELIEEKIKEIGGGTYDSKIGVALDKISTSENEENVTLEVRDLNGEQNKIQTKFSKKHKSNERKYVESKILGESIGYLNVTSWSSHVKVNDKDISELIEDELKNLNNCDSLIIDNRQNGGGNSDFAEKLAGHFIQKNTKYCKVSTRISKTNEMIEKDITINSEGDFLNKKIVILTGPRSISSSEMFVLMLKDTGKAITIGQTTGGGSGNPIFFDLHLGNKDFLLGVSRWRMYRNNGEEIEGNGIEPDITVEINPEDVVNHHDVDLDKALEYLSKK